jgi:hypothetical protein
MVNSAGHGDSDPHASGGDALKCRLRSLASRADEAREFDWVAEVPGRECGKKIPTRRHGAGLGAMYLRVGSVRTGSANDDGFDFFQWPRHAWTRATSRTTHSGGFADTK